MAENKKVKKKINMAGQPHIDPISDTDIELWAEVYAEDKPVDEKDVKTLEFMNTRVVNIGDLTSLMLYFDNVNQADMMQKLNVVVRRLSIMEYIVNDKLGVDQKEIEEYSKKYDEELAEVRKEMERLMKEKEEGEDKEDSDGK